MSLLVLASNRRISIVARLLLLVNSKLSQIISLPISLQTPVMLPCKTVQWAQDPYCRALQSHRNQRMAWVMCRAIGEACPKGALNGCRQQCGETVCTGSESHQMFLESSWGERQDQVSWTIAALRNPTLHVSLLSVCCHCWFFLLGKNSKTSMQRCKMCRPRRGSNPQP